MQREMRTRGVAFDSTTTRWGRNWLELLPLEPPSRADPVGAVVKLRHEATSGVYFPCDSFSASEHERPLADVPLIVEDVLVQARMLAESCAPTDAIKAILDHVAALRAGRS